MDPAPPCSRVPGMPRTMLLAFLILVVSACGSSAAGVDASTTGDANLSDAPAGGATRSDVSFSSDVNLTGYMTTGEASPSGSPGVLLIHQFMNNDEQWGQWPEALAAEGYRVLAFNLRGHGDSDAYDGSLVGILSDPVAAPADMRAALAYLVGSGGADPNRIAIVGTSIGANLTVEAAIAGLAKTYVSLSSRQSAVETYAGKPATGMSSVYYFASENDGGGTQAANAQTMHDLTSGAREIKVYAGVSDHGVAILNNQSDSFGLIEGWLSDTL
jgi:dienelactone hydrolase